MMTNEEIEILKGLMSFIKVENGKFSDTDIKFLKGINSIVNELSVANEENDDVSQWITIKGNHVPVKKGQSKEEVTKEFLNNVVEKKKNDNKKRKTTETREVKTFKNGNDANVYFYSDLNYTKWAFGLSKEEREIITDYTGDRYSDINEYLRNGNTSSEEYSKKSIKILDNIIDKFELKEPIKVYRAISPEIAEKIKDTYTDKAFQSTTITLDMFNKDTNRGNKPLLVLNIPAGKGRGAYINDHSIYKNKEFEFLLKRDSTFKVKKRTTKNGKTIIEMDLIED